MLRRTRLVMVTFGGSAIPVLIHATQLHSAWPASYRESLI